MSASTNMCTTIGLGLYRGMLANPRICLAELFFYTPTYHRGSASFLPVAVSACASASTTSCCQCLRNCLYHCQRPSEQAQAASRATSTEPNTTTRSLKTYRKSRPPSEGLRGKTWPHSHCERNRATTHYAEASARTCGRRQGPRRCRP